VDLARQPSRIEWRGAGTNGWGECAVILQADAATAKRWEQAWAKLVEAFGAEPPAAVKSKLGALQVARWAKDDMASACVRTPQGVGVAVGRDPAALLEGLAVRKNPLDERTWLTLRSDPAVVLGQPDLPRVEVSVAGYKKRVRALALLRFARPLSLSLDTWRIPTNIVREPLISFAAARGVAPVLDRIPWFRSLGLAPLPNQMFAWALGIHPSQNYLAFPNPDPSATLQKIYPALRAEFSRRFSFLKAAKLVYVPQENRITITNLTMAAAFLMAVPEQAPGFLVGGFSLPLYLRGKPAPPALFQQVTDKPRLIYYHWELTQPRVEMLWHAFNYWNIVHAYLPPKKDGAVASWLRDKGLASCLGNTVTLATLESPTEIRVVRSAAVGFTAYELIRLARWLDGKDFPLASRPVTVVEQMRERHKKASAKGKRPAPKKSPGRR
jgi:hypothetical protein